VQSRSLQSAEPLDGGHNKFTLLCGKWAMVGVTVVGPPQRISMPGGTPGQGLDFPRMLQSCCTTLVEYLPTQSAALFMV
jgi:hypothetical protein